MASRPSIDPLTNSNDDHLEIFSLIWLDKDAYSEKNNDIKQKLRSTINHLKTFEDVTECEQYIKQRQ
ncbi:unnamed protein product, partial [Rotaria sp. Silwood1]